MSQTQSADVSTAGDIVDAVAAGVNSLGEQLEASYQELERCVAHRTAELAMATRELSRRALHHDLTGLANRATGFAVLFLDLDNFNPVYDTLGHGAGDQLLVEVARRMTGELRAGDTAARVGGDEFLILLDEVASSDEALSVARRIGGSLRAPHDLDGHRYTVTVSIGVAAARADGPTTADAIVAAADAAMYDAKRTGRGLCVLSSDGRHSQTSFIDVGWGC